MLEALSHFQKADPRLGLGDFKMYVSLCSEMRIPEDSAAGIINVGLAEVDETGEVVMSEAGRKLQFDMNLQQKAVKRIKMDGGEAESLLDEMFAEIE
jgi:hypothetical protein